MIKKILMPYLIRASKLPEAPMQYHCRDEPEEMSIVPHPQAPTVLISASLISRAVIIWLCFYLSFLFI